MGGVVGEGFVCVGGLVDFYRCPGFIWKIQTKEFFTPSFYTFINESQFLLTASLSVSIPAAIYTTAVTLAVSKKGAKRY